MDLHKQDEFIKAIETLHGADLTTIHLNDGSGNNYIQIIDRGDTNNRAQVVAAVSTKRHCQMNTNYAGFNRLPQHIQRDVFELVLELARIPVLYRTLI